ncbi:MAG: hypothetical protein M1342_03305 [Patescibacteria group bacterium]|nr:hypothetical protein [Patescibacteria group bacterium]
MIGAKVHNHLILPHKGKTLPLTTIDSYIDFNHLLESHTDDFGRVYDFKSRFIMGNPHFSTVAQLAQLLRIAAARSISLDQLSFDHIITLDFKDPIGYVPFGMPKPSETIYEYMIHSKGDPQRQHLLKYVIRRQLPITHLLTFVAAQFTPRGADPVFRITTAYPGKPIPPDSDFWKEHVNIATKHPER